MAAIVRWPVANDLEELVVTMRGLTGETAAEREAAEMMAPVGVGLPDPLLYDGRKYKARSEKKAKNIT